MGKSLDLSKPDDKKLFAIFAVMAGLMLFCTAVQLATSILPAKNGRNLILPLGETTREEVAENIYRYIPNVFKDLMAPHGLEKLYHENREEFMRLYEQEKQKLREIMPMRIGIASGVLPLRRQAERSRGYLLMHMNI